MTTITIGAYDESLGDVDYHVDVYVYNNMQIKAHTAGKANVEPCDGCVIPVSEKQEGNAEIHIGFPDDPGIVAHECLHLALDFLRSACGINPADMLTGKEAFLGEEAMVQAFQAVYVQVIEAVKQEKLIQEAMIRR